MEPEDVNANYTRNAEELNLSPLHHFPSPLPNTHPPPAIPLRALGTHQLLARIPSLLGTDLKSFQIILGFKYSGAKLQCHLTQRLHNGVQ